MRDVLVLCHHAVSERWPAHLSVTPSALEWQLSYLLERGYVGATFTRAVTAPPARRTLAVTFDDGFRSVLTLAAPILERLDLPGTLFVPTAFPGRPGPLSWPGIDRWLGGEHEHELTGVSWEEVAGLRSAGWEIGSHTRSHPRLTTLDDASLERELRGSRAELEQRLGERCDSVAYPYGDVDARVAAAAAAAGYRAAGALPLTSEPERPLRWPRVGVYGWNTRSDFRRHTAPVVRRLQRSPAWPALGAAWRAARRVERAVGR